MVARERKIIGSKNNPGRQSSVFMGNYPMFSALQNILGKNKPLLKEAKEGYDQWSANYDNQAGNLMLQLDEELVGYFLNKLDLANKAIADIGCGTGRHWGKLYAGRPRSLVGLDVSGGMLAALIQKFPAASVLLIREGSLYPLDDHSIDCIVSTLTIAHIQHLDRLAREWSRILAPGGEILLTDFHPVLLDNGGQRSFNSGGKTYMVRNHVHFLADIEQAFAASGITLCEKVERYITDELQPFYAAQHAMPVFKKYRGLPLIYGLHLKRN
jgi:ubiquinone/menaquinone biosynthesis C-methylase UbiE